MFILKYRRFSTAVLGSAVFFRPAVPISYTQRSLQANLNSARDVANLLPLWYSGTALNFFLIHNVNKKEKDTMMKPTEILQEHWKAIEEKNFDKARGYLAEDFTFSGPVPKPLGAKEYIEVHQSLLGGLQDWKFNFSILNEQENKVLAKVRITATHTRDLSLPFMPEVSTIRATGKRVALPEEKVEVVLKGDKIAQLKVEQVPEGGVTGLLKQLGVPAKS